VQPPAIIYWKTGVAIASGHEADSSFPVAFLLLLVVIVRFNTTVITTNWYGTIAQRQLSARRLYFRPHTVATCASKISV
jgi:hypothetical protein